MSDIEHQTCLKFNIFKTNIQIINMITSSINVFDAVCMLLL